MWEQLWSSAKSPSCVWLCCQLLAKSCYCDQRTWKAENWKKISKPIKIRVPSMLEFSPSCNHAIWALHILEKICLENAAEMQVPEKMVLLCEVQREITKNIDGAFLSPVPRDAWIHEKLKTRSKNHKLLIHTLSCILYIGAVPIHVILNLTICNK